MTNLLKNFCLVFEETTHPGNLGSIARAAKNMGIFDVRLVNPLSSKENSQAIANAAGATDLLASFQEFDDFDKAIADCHVVLATSARKRALSPKIITVDNIIETLTNHFRA